jgi:hypothetical protein
MYASEWRSRWGRGGTATNMGSNWRIGAAACMAGIDADAEPEAMEVSTF